MQDEFIFRYISTAWLEYDGRQKGKGYFLRNILFHEKFMCMTYGVNKLYCKRIIEYKARKHKENISKIEKYIEKRSTTQSRWDSRKIKRNIQKELDKQNNLCYVIEHKRKM